MEGHSRDLRYGMDRWLPTSYIYHIVWFLSQLFLRPSTWGSSSKQMSLCLLSISLQCILSHYYTPTTELGGYIGFTLSVCPSVCLLTFRVRPVASTVQNGFFPYLVQMINSMRGCVACDDLWLWPISSRSFGLDLENRVRSVASTVLDGFFFIFGTNDHNH